MEDEIDNVVAQLNPTMVSVGTTSGNHAYSLIPADSPYMLNANAYKYIDNQIRKFATSMLETDREYMTNIVLEGVKNGDSVAAISRNLRDGFDKFSKMQTDRITRTEVLRESNHFMIEAWRESGVVAGKQWLTDGNPCPICIEIENQYGEKSLDENFLNEGDTLDLSLIHICKNK